MAGSSRPRCRGQAITILSPPRRTSFKSKEVGLYLWERKILSRIFPGCDKALRITKSGFYPERNLGASTTLPAVIVSGSSDQTLIALTGFVGQAISQAPQPLHLPGS